MCKLTVIECVRKDFARIRSGTFAVERLHNERVLGSLTQLVERVVEREVIAGRSACQHGIVRFDYELFACRHCDEAEGLLAARDSVADVEACEREKGG